jgi:transcriptional regulator with XRE-family HTH domain
MDMEPTSGAGKKPRDRTPEAMAFAAQLRAERGAAKLSQAELAKMSGIGHSTLVRLENGTRVMDTAQLGALCRALGISLTTFAMRADERLREISEAEERRVGNA